MKDPWPRKTSDIRVGLVGLGLMGSSIATCLLSAGHDVEAVETDAQKRRAAPGRLLELLKEARREGLLKAEPARALRRLEISPGYDGLAGCAIALESVVENLVIKRQVLRNIERAVGPTVPIGSNTSAIPITQLQKGAARPGRILGIHWGEPAHTTRFMEIICGKRTSPRVAEAVRLLSRKWGKEPSVLRRDVRGFITNRCMYALMREAFYLVEQGYATVADVDRSLRNDLGYWITFAGPFRFMDLSGVPAYETVMKDLLPELDCSKRVPRLIHGLVKSGARGVSNARGFYPYTPASARRWEKLFLKFTYEIRALAQKYPEDVGDRTGPRRSRSQA